MDPGPRAQGPPTVGTASPPPRGPMYWSRPPLSTNGPDLVLRPKLESSLWVLFVAGLAGRTPPQQLLVKKAPLPVDAFPNMNSRRLTHRDAKLESTRVNPRPLPNIRSVPISSAVETDREGVFSEAGQVAKRGAAKPSQRFFRRTEKVVCR